MLSSAATPGEKRTSVLKRLKYLQPFPPVVMELMYLVAEDEVKFGEITNLLSSDAAVSAEVLRMANSPLLGTWGQVNSVMHAVVILGLERLKGMIMTAALRNYLSPRLEQPVLLGCWRHNLACGILAETLATTYFLPKDPCYTAGLLHDVGRLALLSAYPSDYAEMLDLAERYQVNVLECERGVFGLDHCEAGQWLVKEWGFPEEFQKITGEHHEAPSGSRFDKVAMVQLACREADALGFAATTGQAELGRKGVAGRVPARAWQRLGAEPELSLNVADRINALECCLMG